MLNRCWIILLAFSIHSFGNADDDAKNASPHHSAGWITSIAPLGENGFVAGSATGLPLREASVYKFQSDSADQLEKLYDHPAAIWAVTTTSDGKTVASVDYRGNLVTFDVASSKATTHESVFERWCQNLIATSNGQSLVTGNEAGKLFLWNLSDAKVTKELQLCDASINGLAISKDQNQLAVADGTGTVHLVKLPELEATGTIKVGEGALRCIAYSPEGDALVAGSSDRNLYRVAAKKDAKAESVAKGSDWITRVSISPSGEVAASDSSGKIHFVSSGSVSTIDASSGVWTLCFAGPSQLLVGTRKHGIVLAGQSWTFEPAAPSAESEE